MPEHLAEANPETLLKYADGQEAHFHCRDNSNLISTCSSLDSKGPGRAFGAVLWASMAFLVH